MKCYKHTSEGTTRIVKPLATDDKGLIVCEEYSKSDYCFIVYPRKKYLKSAFALMERITIEQYEKSKRVFLNKLSTRG